MAERVRHSRAVEDYLKAIYKLQREGGPAPTTLLAAGRTEGPADHGLLDGFGRGGIELRAPGW